jgi:DNA-directed RNA polymerase sigma subunit (sigma70/sigma32)
LIDAEMRDEIDSILATLDDREQLIMRKRFGFDGEDTYVCSRSARS